MYCIMNYNLFMFLRVYHCIVFNKISYVTKWNAPHDARMVTQIILPLSSSSDILVTLGITNEMLTHCYSLDLHPPVAAQRFIGLAYWKFADLPFF